MSLKQKKKKNLLSRNMLNLALEILKSRCGLNTLVGCAQHRGQIWSLSQTQPLGNPWPVRGRKSWGVEKNSQVGREDGVRVGNSSVEGLREKEGCIQVSRGGVRPSRSETPWGEGGTLLG